MGESFAKNTRDSFLDLADITYLNPENAVFSRTTPASAGASIVERRFII